MVQIGSFYPGIVFSSLFKIIGRLGFWRWYHLLRRYGMGPLGPLTLPRGGVAGNGCVADEGDEEGEGHALRGVGYVALAVCFSI